MALCLGAHVARHGSAVALALLVITSIAAAEEPKGFAEFPWGQSRAKLNDHCSDAGYPDFMNCEERAVTLAGQRSVPRLWLQPDNRLRAYSVHVRVGAYSALRAVALEKFGPPASTTSRRYETQAGAVVMGEVLAWSWPGGTSAELSERCGRADEACLWVMTKPYAEFVQGRERQERERAKKAF